MTEHEMHDHNRDLIMALAEGALEGARRQAAETAIAACDVCQSELGAQRLALDALATAAPPRLTDLEAARMRRALRDDLGLVTPEPIASRREERNMSWQRWSVGLSVAAVLLLFVAVVPALNLFGASDSGSGDEFAFATTTAATAAESLPGSAADQAAPTTAASLQSAEGGTADTTTTQPPPRDDDLAVDFGVEPDLELVQLASRRGLEETGDARNLLGYGGDLDSTSLDPDSEGCAADGLARFSESRLPVSLGTAVVLDEDAYVVAYVDVSSGEVEIVAHSVTDCAVVATSG